MTLESFTFTTLIEQGYKIIPATVEQAEYDHRLFGVQSIDGAWCPNCNKPLLSLASIDTRDPRLGLTHLPLARIPLLYCMRCCISWADGDVNTTGLQRHRHTHACGTTADSFSGNGCEFYYHVSAAESVSILVYNEGYDAEYLPYPDYPDSFPGIPVMLQPINEQERWYCQRMNRYEEEHPAESENIEASYAFQTQYDYLNDWTHQLGGEPCFWNPPCDLTCPCCGAVMPFLALIEDNVSAGTPDMSGGAGGQLTFHLCPDCSIIGVYDITT